MNINSFKCLITRRFTFFLADISIRGSFVSVINNNNNIETKCLQQHNTFIRLNRIVNSEVNKSIINQNN